MQIFVKAPTGKEFAVEVQSAETIGDINSAQISLGNI
jgi:hypothetical protein